MRRRRSKLTEFNLGFEADRSIADERKMLNKKEEA